MLILANVLSNMLFYLQISQMTLQMFTICSLSVVDQSGSYKMVAYLSDYLNLYCLATCKTVVWHTSFPPRVWLKRKMSYECDQSAKLLFLTLVIAHNFTFGASLLSRLKCAWLLRPSEAWRHSSWRTSQWGNIMLQCIECIVNEKGEYCWIVTFKYVTYYARRQFCMYYKLVATSLRLR